MWTGKAQKFAASAQLKCKIICCRSAEAVSQRHNVGVQWNISQQAPLKMHFILTLMPLNFEASTTLRAMSSPVDVRTAVCTRANEPSPSSSPSCQSLGSKGDGQEVPDDIG
eukprot:CAMPEP_0115837002 /NCGR_PEP_ID=MMETSP0287-20121206/4996_1 /TAXON_ID=412157 /ORGANISM="Chrysochromulina rotalis, Strain UIO044" /LENGTH=110 /DNA_ID=CAMNT_0003290499 /DNA_START=954 /DNA_END=1283 /DNA_ORIENTATION=+